MIEEIKKRMNYLVEQKAKTETMVHVIDGAIQDCEYWLEQLEKNGKEENPIDQE